MHSLCVSGFILWGQASSWKSDWVGRSCLGLREGPAWEAGGWADPESQLPAPSVHSISNKELSDLIEQLQKNADQVERNIVDTEAKMHSVSTSFPNFWGLLHLGLYPGTRSPGSPTSRVFVVAISTAIGI